MRTSIIVTSYNYGRYLSEAIESALTQTLLPDEVIVVDDGSSDDSLAVARRYPVRVVAQPHLGAARAKAAGVAAARGDCFVMLDADDRLAADYLEQTVPILASRPTVGLVYTAVMRFGTVERYLPAEPFSLGRMLAANRIHGSALTRRRAYDETGGYLAADLPSHEDWHVFLSLLERGWEAVPTNDTVLYYRQHAHSRNQVSERTHDEVVRRIMLDHPALYRPSPHLWYWARHLGRRVRRLRVPGLAPVYRRLLLLSAGLAGGS